MSDRKSTEHSLFEDEIFVDARATYESLANTLPLSLLIKDADGRRLFANKAYLKLRGKTLEDLVGKRDEDLFSPEIAQAYAEDDRKVLQSGRSLHNVEQTRDARGRLIWIERVKSPIVDPQGRVIGLQLLFWDVTARVRAEQGLERERYLLATLLDNIPDSIYFKDTKSRFLRISKAMARKFGFEHVDEVVGRTDADIFTAEHAKAARKDELQIIRTGKPLVDRVERETWPDRDDTWCLSTKMPLRNQAGRIIGTFGISRDVTELKQSQDALRAALAAAAEANRAKSDFLANMSHEIRTPMNAIIGMTELLAQTTLTREQRDYVELVSQSADALLGLLNDILDFSKIEARKLELEFIPFSLRDVIGKTGQTLSLRASEKGLEIICRVAPDIPDRLQGDPGRLRQILINLISNAIKFTEEGEVTVDVSRAEGSADDPLCLTFSVRDTGIGIPPEKQAAVLEAFNQADTSTTRRYGGTGLGLTISRQLVELMGGSLQLESQPGVGTQFDFTIPLDVSAGQENDPEQRLESLADSPVLVVDDNATNRRLLSEIFTAWRFDPHTVSSGPEAIEAIRQAAADGNPYRLVILDGMMPDMDGFEVATRIRRDCERADTRMIMLSSASRTGDVARCEDIGIARYMTKPVIQSELLETVLHVLDVDAEPDAEAAGPELPRCAPLRVLVAEDGLANQQVALGLLRAAGHDPVLAADGCEAVERWSKEPYDVILMDMHMPRMDGLEATRVIRQREREARGSPHIPIIALTAAAMPEDAEACLQAGMDDYLPKPIHSQPLMEMIARHTGGERHPRTAADTICDQKPSPGQSSADAAPESSAASTKSTAPSVQAGRGVDGQRDGTPVEELEAVMRQRSPSQNGFVAIDPEAAAKRVAGGAKGVRQLAEVFREEAGSLIVQIESALEGGDLRELRRAAHTLKGSSKLFAAERVEQAAWQLESHARDQDLQAAAASLPRLRDEVRLLREELARLVG